MKYACLYGDNCYYDGTVDTRKQGFSMKRVQGNEFYWHYRCSEGNIRVPLFLTEKHLEDLRTYLKKHLKSKEGIPDFVVEILKEDRNAG